MEYLITFLYSENAIILQGCVEYMSELIHPIIACFSESESRVRYQAVEALFNVVKIARGDTLLHFPLVFDALARLSADSEPQVKQAAELLDRLVKVLLLKFILKVNTNFLLSD